MWIQSAICILALTDRVLTFKGLSCKLPSRDIIDLACVIFQQSVWHWHEPTSLQCREDVPLCVREIWQHNCFSTGTEPCLASGMLLNSYGNANRMKISNLSMYPCLVKAQILLI